MPAPVVVFAYNRQDHLEETILSLEKCSLCDKTQLFVFSDAAKNENSRDDVGKVRTYLKNYKASTRFMSVSVVENEKNKGLAKNIVEGVSGVINKYGRAIIVEDDVTVAPYFLEYMNDALDFYENDKTVFSVGGLTVPMNLPEDYNYDIIKTQRCSSYCWATWKDRWETIDWSVSGYKGFRINPVSRKSFNKWGNDRAQMLDDQMNGRINSWAIRFDYQMWKNGQYNILPKKTLANHMGADGRGTHSNSIDSERNRINDKLWLDCTGIKMEKIEASETVRREFCKNYNSKRTDLCKRYISNIIYPFVKNES